MLHLTDLDELIEKVLNKYAKVYIEESLNAYRSGAYRASVSMAWVAICVDIIEKIKELSHGGDLVAKAYHDRLNNVIKITDKNKQDQEMMSFERNLITIAKDLELISLYEEEQLLRVKRDRNSSVHPTLQRNQYIVITPETARNHIVNACNSLLTQLPTQGKALVHTLIDLVVEGSFNDSSAAKTILSADYYLGRAREDLIKEFSIKLLKELLGDKELDIKIVKRIAIAINVTTSIRKQIALESIRDFLPKLLVKVDNSRIKRLLILINECSFVERFLDDGMKIRLQQSVREMSGKEIVEFNISGLADKNDQIRKELLERFDNSDSEDQKIILTGSTSETLKDNAIKFFINSGYYDASYRNGKEILLPYAKLFKQNDVKRILDGSIGNISGGYKNNQILNAGGIDQIFKSLFEITSNYSSDNELIWNNFLEKIEESYSELWNDLKIYIEENFIPF